MSEELKIEIGEVVTVGELAGKLNVPVSKVIGELMKNGIMATINENIDFETAQIIGEYLGFNIDRERQETVKEVVEKKTKSSGKLVSRPPIVAVMGHVDHGKTTLLDAIRESRVAQKEAGGITQHIGAYQVEKNGKTITFLDTPGHAAFESMRARGAEVTDIAIIVVAANDGIKPQTSEAIDHAKRANVPMIVAINKIDLPEANIDRVKQQLTEIGLIPEDWGGDVITIPVSAKDGKGLDDLLEMVLLVSGIHNFEAEKGGEATGVIIESHMAVGKGPVATVLVKNGTLKVSDTIQAGATYGKVKIMEDYKGKRIKEAGPSTPVRISGLKAIAAAGDIVQVFADERMSKDQAFIFQRQQSSKKISEVKKLGLAELTASYEAGMTKDLNIILKADVKGSLDAIKESLGKFKTPEVQVKIISEGVGLINESDIMMAKTSNALVIGFNVPLSATINQLSIREKVKVLGYQVIYELLDDIRNALESLLPPLITEVTVGKLEILKIFKTAKGHIIAGGKVTSGKLEKGLEVKIIRNAEEEGKGKINSVKREKDEVKECGIGMECGLSIETNVKLMEKDIIEAFILEETKRHL
ncbi:MAG: Translation initiation factor IF-2 [candidate division CPR2 bacterium GW2011_GWC1_41_48]|uniref:Translation initiation factor IF-2 n=1 Tax=candidate division CPR2 bacterium GW2011_GWC1_41_48 TaxID=1618344 RepID=A0A0G0W9G5_UNCC2|nr:MAG: Translation initiation factor IF-2 [candidate division CPR2 bacterium GW2011_GWC2_39_35]KKR29479.1 MAG: Translation initiation factor IF-2 [candidate division CPR2 bacterium GW2011_GWD2_39_7]KKR29704.1 MAG: Translation initiation factor IF-2 [candidate division CPR2 bacterium GW2011_GWD1_39_7]KKS09634.1 MAG: Translation initiation factor IF-2 [candidate division CPR2 bacterium GW2011_GWC1_41_48]